MTDYVKVNVVDRLMASVPGPVPAPFAGLSDHDLADLTWAPSSLYDNIGYWPVVETIPAYNPQTQRLTNVWETLTVDPSLPIIHGQRAVITVNTYIPQQVSKIDFSRLFTVAERAAMIGARKRIDQMSVEDFSDIMNLGYVYLAIIFESFELPAEFIELNHPQTILGLNTLVAAGILTSARASRILSGLPPE